MKIIKWIALLQVAVILSIIFSGCTEKTKEPKPVAANPEFELKESGEKLDFYADGIFNFNIITSADENESYELAKATVFKQARALNKKRPEFMRDNAEIKEGSKSILVGNTKYPLSKEAAEILNKNKNNHTHTMYCSIS